MARWVHIYRSLIAAMLLMAGLGLAAEVRAYIYDPPWADAMWAHYPTGDRLDTTTPANLAKAGLDGPYDAFSSNASSARATLGTSFAQSDAVWWLLGHGGPGVMTTYNATNGETYLRLSSSQGSCTSPHVCLSASTWSQLHRVRLMLFEGCNTGDTVAGGNSLPRHANVTLGVDSAIGFSATIFFGPAQNGWSTVFASSSMDLGYSVTNAAWAATNWLGAHNGGDYSGYDSLVIWGGSTKLDPPAYGS